jgi:hypothetical protein
VPGLQPVRRQHGPGEHRGELRQPGDDPADRGATVVGQPVRSGTAGQERLPVQGQREVLVRPVPAAARERQRRERHRELVPPPHPAGEQAGQHDVVGGGERVGRADRELELAVAVLGVDLLDRETGPVGGREQVEDERFDVQQGAQPVGVPARAVAGREHHLELTAEARLEPALGEPGDGPAQQAAGADRRRRPVLVEHLRRCPRQPGTEHPEAGEVGAQPQVADHPEPRGERDGVVDAEHVPAG